MKLQTTVQVTQLVEIDIEFPYYCQKDDVFFKVESEERAVRVSNYKGTPCIMVTSPAYSNTMNEIAKSTACTKLDFEIAQQTVLNNIISKQKTVAA